MKKFLFAAILFLFVTSTFAADPGADKDVKDKIPPKGYVALTFDDGPNPAYTKQIVDILNKYNVKATFFVVGASAKKYSDMIKLEHDSGMAVNSHSYTHPMLTKVSESQLQDEISKPSEVVNDIIGIKPKCLRYPFNDSNSHVRAEIRAHGMTPVPMGYNSFDYDRPGTEKIVSNVLDHLSNREVILMHDGFDKREETVAALPQIIEGIKKKGYGFALICA